MRPRLRAWSILGFLFLAALSADFAFAQESLPSEGMGPSPSPSKAPLLPGLQSAQPPATGYSFSFPTYGKDLFSVVMVNGPQSKAPEDAKLFAERASAECAAVGKAGMLAFQEGNLAGAEEFLLRATNGECDNGLVSFYLGSVYEAKRQYFQSIEPLMLASALLRRNYPDHRYVLYTDALLGRSFFRLGRFQESLFYLERVLERYPDDFPHQYFAGRAALKAGAVDRGVQLLERVVTNATRVQRSKQIAVSSCAALAEVFLRTGNLAKADSYLGIGFRFDARNAELVRLRNELAQIVSRSRQGATPFRR